MSIMGRMLQYRGVEQDFDADKMLPGMFAVSTDKKYVRMCFSPGVVERIALYSAFEEDVKQIQLILATCEDIQVAVEAFKSLAEQHSEKAKKEADRSKMYADRAEEAANRAEAVTDVGISTIDKPGIVKPDNNTLGINQEGTIYNKKYPDMTVKSIMSNNAQYVRVCRITVNNTYQDMPLTFSFKGRGSLSTARISIKFKNINGTNPEINTFTCQGDRMYINKLRLYKITELENIYELWCGQGESYDVFSVSDVSYTNGGVCVTWLDETSVGLPITYHKRYTCSYADISITDNLLATVSGTALDAKQGKILDNKITSLNRNLPIAIETNVKYDSRAINAVKSGNKVDINIAFSGVNFYANSPMFTLPDICHPKTDRTLAMLCKRATSSSSVASSVYVDSSGRIVQRFNNDGEATKWEGIILGSYSTE